MSGRTGFKNIQAATREETFSKFEDAFAASGANSKGEFIGILLDLYTNPPDPETIKVPDPADRKRITELERELKAVTEIAEITDKERVNLQNEKEQLQLTINELQGREPEKIEVEKKVERQLTDTEILIKTTPLNAYLVKQVCEAMQSEPSQVLIDMLFIPYQERGWFQDFGVLRVRRDKLNELKQKFNEGNTN